MISANKMAELADQHINNKHIAVIEKMAEARAKDGKFFVKLWEGKPESMDTSLIFMEQYDVEALNHLKRQKYTIVSIRDPHGVVSLYLGWGFISESALKTAIQAEES